jgi:hypothetical protein
MISAPPISRPIWLIGSWKVVGQVHHQVGQGEGAGDG